MEIKLADCQVVDEREFRAMHPNVSFPAVLGADILADFGGDVVLAAPAPTITATQTAYRDGVTQDALGNWVYAWAVRDWSEEEIAAASIASAASRKAGIQAEIDRLEGPPNYMNRGARELSLRLMEKEAAIEAAAYGMTQEQVLASIPYYGKLKALDDQILVFRGQLGD